MPSFILRLDRILKTLRPYQTRVAAHLHHQPRSSDLSDPGLGKTLTTTERLREFRADGFLRYLLVVAPDPVVPGWAAELAEQWGDGVVWHDCRTGRKDVKLLESWAAGSARPPATGPGEPMHVYGVTADRLRTMLTVPAPKKGSSPRVAWERLDRLKKSGLGVVLDEAHLYTVPDSSRARVARALAWNADVVTACTGTLMGRDTHGRLWGHTAIVAPWILAQLQLPTFRDFKIRYCVCTDPAGKVVSGGPMIREIDHDRVARDLLEPQRAFTARVTEAEALPDLPPLTILRRTGGMGAEAGRMLRQMRKERRVTSGAAGSVELVTEAQNGGVAAMRCLEMSSGWLEGKPIHADKLELLRGVLDELGDDAACSLWAVRSRTLLSAALVAAGVTPDDAMRMVAAIPPSETPEEEFEEEELDTHASSVKVSSPEYRAVIARARSGGVGVLHGGTPSRARDTVIADWRSGRLSRCALHPGVGGAGLNLQHVSKSVYVEPCGSSIQWAQSLKRHHRSGQGEACFAFLLGMEDGPEWGCYQAHLEQREAEDDLMSWMGGAKAERKPAARSKQKVRAQASNADLPEDLLAFL